MGSRPCIFHKQSPGSNTAGEVSGLLWKTLIRCHLIQPKEAVDNCKEAIKLKQDSLKTIIVAVRALRGMKDFQKALDMLEIAEQIPEVDMKMVDKYRRETTKEMKEHMLKI